jgi:hypothetical protein
MIVESPTKANKIQKFLGDDFKVCCCLGNTMLLNVWQAQLLCGSPAKRQHNSSRVVSLDPAAGLLSAHALHTGRTQQLLQRGGLLGVCRCWPHMVTYGTC